MRVCLNQNKRKLLFSIKVSTFDLSKKEIYNQVKDDYDLVRKAIKDQGFEALTGKMGFLFSEEQKVQDMVRHPEAFMHVKN